MDKPFDIGIIVKLQGLKGEVRVTPVTDDPSRFSLLNEVFVVNKKNDSKTYEIEKSRLQNNMVILKFIGVDSPSDAEKLIGSTIKIPAELGLKLNDDEYYVRDLLDMEVYTEENEKLGIIGEVIKTGANDVYLIKTPDKSEILIPAIKQCIKSVSINNRRMIVRLMDGMR